MTKEELKNKVLAWLKAEKVDLTGKLIRVYKYRGVWEVWIYGEPMEISNTRKSHRKMEPDADGNNSTYGIHQTTYRPFVHISEDDLKNEAEKEFILENLNNL